MTWLLASVGGEASTGRAVLEAFLFDVPVQVGRLRGALTQSDLESVSHQAHKLRGAASYFAGTVVCSLAAEMEEAAKNSDTARVSALLEDFSTAFMAFKEHALKEFPT